MNPKIVSSIIYFFTEHFSRIISPISIVLISQLFKTSLWGWNSLGFSKISVFEEHLSIRVFSWIAEKLFHVYLLFLTGKMQDKCWVRKLWKTRNHYIFERPMFRLLWLFFPSKITSCFLWDCLKSQSSTLRSSTKPTEGWCPLSHTIIKTCNSEENR